MKDILDTLGMIAIIIILFICIFTVSDIANKDEQIKILEQSLQEQIQKKEVYMKMLEEKGE